VASFPNVNLLKIEADLDENEDFMREYDIRSLPSFVLVDENDKWVGMTVGAFSEEQFIKWLTIAIEEHENA
jgi:thioredoxin-related protein